MVLTMNMINFIFGFQMKILALNSSKSKESSRESSVRSAPVANTTGWKTSAVSSVPPVGSEPVSRAVQSWKAVIYQLGSG